MKKKNLFSLHFSSANSSDSYYSYSNSGSGFEPEKEVPVQYPQNMNKINRHSSSSKPFPEETISTVFEVNEFGGLNKNTNNDDDDDDDSTQNSHSHIYFDYFITRTKRSHIRSPLLFDFKINGEDIFYAKTKGMIANQVFIAENNIIHIKKGQFDFILTVSNHRHLYVLQKKGEEKELMIIRISTDYGNEYGPRIFEITWPESNLRHISRIPKRNEKGQWVLKSGGKYVIKSQKNAIILDEYEKPSILIRKIRKATLEVEAIRSYKPIFLFSLGIASFICPD